jgi:hypothetical protein
MKQKTNESLRRLKRSIWPVLIRAIEEYGMIWNVIMESRQTINVYFGSVGRKGSSPRSNTRITDVPVRQPIRSSLLRTS